MWEANHQKTALQHSQTDELSHTKRSTQQISPSARLEVRVPKFELLLSRTHAFAME